MKKIKQKILVVLMYLGLSIGVAYYESPDEIVVAVIRGDYSTVEILLEMDMGSADTVFFGYRLLHHAVARGDVDIAKLLIENGAEVDARSADMFGFTPLYLAVAGRRFEMMGLLIEKGADINKVIEIEKKLEFRLYCGKFMEM